MLRMNNASAIEQPTPGAGHGAPGRALSEEQIQASVEGLAMLAEPTRLRLLWALRGAELGVTALAQAAGCTPTVASQHLSKLRIGGLVQQRAVGRERIYRLRGEHLDRLLDEAVAYGEHAAPGHAQPA